MLLWPTVFAVAGHIPRHEGVVLRLEAFTPEAVLQSNRRTPVSLSGSTRSHLHCTEMGFVLECLYDTLRLK